MRVEAGMRGFEPTAQVYRQMAFGACSSAIAAASGTLISLSQLTSEVARHGIRDFAKGTGYFFTLSSNARHTAWAPN